MSEEMNKGIKDIKNISLTLAEKKLIFNKVMQIPVVSPYKSVASLWSFAYRRLTYVTAFLLILVMVGGTLAYADEMALPGDLLYPVKRQVTEAIRDILAVAPASRAEWEAAKAIRRLSEAEALALKNNLTPEHRDEIEKDFNKNVATFHESVRSISTKTHKGDDLDTSFDEAVKKHSDILENIRSHKNDGEQQEVNSLKQTVLKASQVKSIETDKNNEESTEKSSSSKKEMKRNDEDSR
jgi:hypothetical protein